MFHFKLRGERYRNRRIKIKLSLYISLIEQIQFSSVISKSYTQLPAEECYEEHIFAQEMEKRKKITKTATKKLLSLSHALIPLHSKQWHSIPPIHLTIPFKQVNKSQ